MKKQMFTPILAVILMALAAFSVSACKDKNVDEEVDLPSGDGGGGGGGSGPTGPMSLYFDGSGKRVTLTDAWYTGDFTMCFWMKPNSVSGQTLLSMSDSDKYFWLSFDNNELDWQFEDAADSDIIIDGTAAFTVGNTYQICLVADHSQTTSDAARLYVNGVLVGGSGATDIGAVAATFSTLTMGYEPEPLFQAGFGNKIGNFDGDIDHFMIWDMVLPANSIAQLYSSGSGLDPRASFSNYTLMHLSSLQVYLPMDENDILSGGSAILRDTENNLNATPVGFSSDDYNDDLW